jgi:hypothetical protein
MAARTLPFPASTENCCLNAPARRPNGLEAMQPHARALLFAAVAIALGALIGIVVVLKLVK